jgi:Xaa-Pro dipeptidase
MRTVWIGHSPEKAKDMMKTCEEALDAALSMVRPGNTCADVHNAAQAVIDRRGYTDNYRKRTGYGIGISFAPDWGEGNIVSLFHNVNRELQPGMCFHMPPALREYGLFTVGVSETVLVTETGCRTFSTIPRSMLEV